MSSYMESFVKLQSITSMKNVSGLRARGGSRAASTSKMEHFVIIVNDVNYYHKVLHLGCSSSTRSASESNVRFC